MDSKQFLYFQAEWYLVVFVLAETWGPEIHPFAASLLLIALTLELVHASSLPPPLAHRGFFLPGLSGARRAYISRSTRVCVRHLTFSMVSNNIRACSRRSVPGMYIRALCLNALLQLAMPIVLCAPGLFQFSPSKSNTRSYDAPGIKSHSRKTVSSPLPFLVLGTANGCTQLSLLLCFEIYL